MKDNTPTRDIPQSPENTLIHKVSFDSHFTIISNRMIQDQNITWAAKGLLMYLVSRPKDWKINRNHLANLYSGDRQTCGKSAIDSMFKELISAGYIIYTKTEKTTGRMIQRYDVYPIPYEEFKIILPYMDNPAMGIPPSIVSKENIVSKETHPLTPSQSPKMDDDFSIKKEAKKQRIRKASKHIRKAPITSKNPIICKKPFDKPSALAQIKLETGASDLVMETVSKRHAKFKQTPQGILNDLSWMRTVTNNLIEQNQSGDATKAITDAFKSLEVPRSFEFINTICGDQIEYSFVHHTGRSQDFVRSINTPINELMDDCKKYICFLKQKRESRSSL